MTAGMGDGGPCHPRDNIALRWLAWRLSSAYDLFAAIGNSREHQAEHIAEFLVALARDGGWREIWLHGEAFKPGLDCLEGSYSRLIAHFIRAQGMTVSYIDPRTRPSVRSVRGVVLLAHNAEIAHDYDAGRSKPQFYCQFEPGSVIVDPWRRTRSEDVPGCRLILYGNTRPGLGQRVGAHTCRLDS